MPIGIINIYFCFLSCWDYKQVPVSCTLFVLAYQVHEIEQHILFEYSSLKEESNIVSVWRVKQPVNLCLIVTILFFAIAYGVYHIVYDAI